MTSIEKPARKPANPRFSPGPTTKFPGWNLSLLETALIGRSHRSKEAIERMQYLLRLTREVLQVPDSHLIAIVPGSDTGAVEMAMWNMLGARPVEVLAWESFGKMWVTDVLEQLKVEQAEAKVADFGELPDLASVDFSHDVVFTWNGTTSGARVPNGDWIPADREGLTICDATSAAFAQELPFDKLDVVTYSWQKVMGGEAQHGILIISPRAIEHLESYTPPWPIPKLFRLTKGGKLIRDLFEGMTINTVSMLAVEDHIKALEWAKSLGGLPAMIERANANAKAKAQAKTEKNH
jgi:phosphoserine aminotransferase